LYQEKVGTFEPSLHDQQFSFWPGHPVFGVAEEDLKLYDMKSKQRFPPLG
jgi:hypothetical protein